MMFIEPGKPMQNAFVEKFNRLYREEILYAYLFYDIGQARILSQKWKEDYNYHHPHQSLGWISPIQYKPLRGKGNFSSEFIYKAEINDDLFHKPSLSSALTKSPEIIEWPTKSSNEVLLT